MTGGTCSAHFLGQRSRSRVVSLRFMHGKRRRRANDALCVLCVLPYRLALVHHKPIAGILDGIVCNGTTNTQYHNIQLGFEPRVALPRDLMDTRQPRSCYPCMLCQDRDLALVFLDLVMSMKTVFVLVRSLHRPCSETGNAQSGGNVLYYI